MKKVRKVRIKKLPTKVCDLCGTTAPCRAVFDLRKQDNPWAVSCLICNPYPIYPKRRLITTDQYGSDQLKKTLRGNPARVLSAG